MAFFLFKKRMYFEEVSTTHFNEDSVYRDNSIQMLPRNERKTLVDHWGDFNDIMLKLLILDFDGTVIDSNYIKQNSINEF